MIPYMEPMKNYSSLQVDDLASADTAGSVGSAVPRLMNNNHEDVMQKWFPRNKGKSATATDVFAMACTYGGIYMNLSWTSELSPPHSGLPHVTTVPSARMAAKAESVPQICSTFLS